MGKSSGIRARPPMKAPNLPSLVEFLDQALEWALCASLPAQAIWSLGFHGSEAPVIQDYVLGWFDLAVICSTTSAKQNDAEQMGSTVLKGCISCSEVLQESV